jgi:hypothetical protein
MTNPTTTPRYYHCPECDIDVLVLGTMTYTMLLHMVNKGEITVGEARAELATRSLLDMDSRELLASWVLDRADQGDDWKAGDPVTLPCGCRVSYDGTQHDAVCDAGARCEVARKSLYVPC